MGKHVKAGDLLQVVFAPARWSVQTEEPINGHRAFAIDSGAEPLAGDRWEVMVLGMNPARTVYFVEPLNLVEAADGLSEVLTPFAPFYHAFIREAEARLATLLSTGACNSADDEADALDEILGNCLLPDAYVAAALSRFEAHRHSPAAS